MKFFWFTLCLNFSILSAKETWEMNLLPNPLIEIGVSSVVNGVNTITGDFVDASIDLTIPGPEPLVLERSYASSQYNTECYYNSWRHNHQSWVETAKVKKTEELPKRVMAMYKEMSGRGAFYGGEYSDDVFMSELTFSKRETWQGMTNCADGVITARNNPKHNRMVYEHWDHGLRVTNASGSKYEFKCIKDTAHGHIYSLAKERKPNWRSLEYTRSDVRHIDAVKLIDKSEKVCFSSMAFNHDPLHKGFFIKASDGRKVFYALKTVKNRHFISKVERPNAPTESYEYDRDIPLMTKKMRPDNRYTEIEYYLDKKEQVGDEEVLVGDTHAFRKERVKLLKAPVGSDATPIVTHRFFYYLNHIDGHDYFCAYNRQGSTSVYDAYNHKTQYLYTSEHRLSEIRKLIGRTEPYPIYSRETFIWGDENSDESGYLQATYLQDSANNTVKARTFEYDSYGNVARDTIYGNITGNSKPIIQNGRFPIENGCDRFAKTFKYGKGSVPHLITEELDDNGKGVIYTYVPDTELVESKLTTFQGKIKLREFYVYHGYGVVTHKIIDDGSSPDKDNLENVTQRLMTYIHPQTVAPYGLPERIDEMYFDLETGKEVLIKRLMNTHSKEGFLRKQEVYDANEKLAYTLEWDYDDHGNVILEKDAIGQTIERRYDANDNLIYESGPAHNRYTIHDYDYSNRRIRTEEFHTDGTHLVTHFRYDYLGNRIAIIDPFGNETKFSYDEFGRAISATYAPIPNERGDLIETSISNEYDIDGNVTRFVDQRSEVVMTSYNVHGKPTAIHYPDNTHEYFEYNLDGSLKKSIAKNGAITTYAYDCFQNLIQKDIFSSDQELLSSTTSKYSPFHILSTTDAAGLETVYDYDGGGRLISVSKGDRLTTFELDSLGRVKETREWYGAKAARVKIVDYDFLNRVKEERIQEDSTQKLLRKTAFSYDADGNISLKTVHNQAGAASTITEYKGPNQPIKEVDAKGNVTIIHYNYQARNGYGQTVLEITKTDSKGNQTITTMNALQKPGLIVRKNAIGANVSKKELFYSGIGDCQYVLETVITPEAPDRQVITTFSHDALHRMRDVVEAVGTPEQKRTEIRYNTCGQKEFIIKPDGVQILHTYDFLGRLDEFRASDNSFAYKYTYDKNDNPKEIIDLKNNTQTIRDYDDNGRMKSEQFGSGQSVSYDYDSLDRVTQLTFSDYTQVNYVYDAMNLIEVKRKTSIGEVKYVHTYLSHDLSGNPTEVRLAGKAGIEKYQHDLLGRVILSQIDEWSEEIKYDSVGNLEEVLMKNKLSNKPIQSKYTYDDLYQLKTETGVAKHKYAFDSLYNCVSQDGQARKINALNQVLEQEGVSYEYDLNGNRIKDKSATYKYDALDRLIEVLQEDKKWEYIYDAFNRRISKESYSRKGRKWILSEKVSYLYRGQDELGSCDASGKIIELRILGVGKGAEIGASVAFELQNNTYVPIHDHNGNVVNLIEAESGKIVERYFHSAFREERILDGNGNPISESALDNPWRYASKRIDAETGFLNFGRRYYDPITSRWLSPDPIGFEGGPNLYAYVLNSPLSHIDLYGLIQANNLPRVTYDDNFENRHTHYASEEEFWEKAQTHDYHFRPYYERSRVYDLHLPDSPNIGIGFINGMNNTYNEAYANTEYISRLASGYNVHAVYNATHGFSNDLKECLMGLNKVATEPVRQLHKMWNNFFSKSSPNAKFLMICHSQGAIHVCNALLDYPENLRSRILVVAIAPGGYIYEKSCAQVIHYRAESKRDFIPDFDREGAKRSKETIITLRSHPDANAHDHSCTSPTYAEPLVRHFKNYFKSNGKNL